MIPRSLFHKSRIGIAKHMLCTGRKTTKLLKPFQECTRMLENFVLSHSVRFYTYSLQKAVWNNKYVTVGNKQIDKCLCEGQRGIKTKVNSSALALQQQVTALTTKRSRKKTLTRELEVINMPLILFPFILQYSQRLITVINISLILVIWIHLLFY
jgi:predicted AAA+ superfamily ATPase